MQSVRPSTTWDRLVPALVERIRGARDALGSALAALPGVQAAPPPGGMYAFVRVAAAADSVAFARKLVREHGLGLAPGRAFGAEGEGWLRWCFATREVARLRAGVDRLAAVLGL